ncbi:MAG: DUF4034 domain-containing protein [Verrucomicrobiales bacterium]|nr:DUF4034 domain-containing protein [Verrucomicrobiales bacterium]
MPSSRPWFVVCVLGWLIVILGLGCSPETKTESESEASVSPAHSAVTSTPDRSSLTNEVAPTITTWPDPGSVTADPLEWNRRTLAQSYRQYGRKDAAWDEAAMNALEGFAQQRAKTSTNAPSQGSEWTRKAMEAGCTDPMVGYLALRVLYGGWADADADRATRYRGAAEALAASEYPGIRKFYAWLRAAQAWKAAHGSVKGAGGVYGPMRREAFRALTGVLQTADTPEGEALEALEQFVEELASHSHQEDELLPTVNDYLTKRWPGSPRALTLRGRNHVALAWNRRGGKYADDVREAGWSGFNAHLEAAEQVLEASWKLDATRVETALAMMRVELGQGRGRMRMEMWFDRAMKLDPACYEAVQNKAWYLQPKWHGSEEQVLAFGRRCVAAKEWRGRVPLMLVDVHVMLATERTTGLQEKHWTQPGVWEDVRASFERFFELNPEATGWFHNYAYHAYQCRAYDVFLELLPKLGTVNEAYFGGHDAFEGMIQTAEKATGRKAVR